MWLWKAFFGSEHLVYADGGANPPATSVLRSRIAPLQGSGAQLGAIGAQHAGGATQVVPGTLCYIRSACIFEVPPVGNASFTRERSAKVYVAWDYERAS